MTHGLKVDQLELYIHVQSLVGWKNLQFEKWMDHFINHVKHLQKPVLLIYDGHGSHMTYGTIKKAIDSSVIILCLPPHTSHAL